MADDKNPESTDNDKKLENKSMAKQEQPATQQPKADKKAPSDMFNAKPMPKMKAKSSKKSWLIPAVISILVIVAILVSSWTLYQQHLFNQNWQQLQSKIDSQLNEQTGTIRQTKNATDSSIQTLGQTQNRVNQLAANNRQLNESLVSTQEKIKALSGRQKQDWMLAEASYLIKIAQLQLTLQKDKTTAIQLLKTADSRIIEIADNSLLPIRQAIAKDLSDLSLILEPDLVGLSFSLDAINKQVPNLEIVALQFDPLQKKHEQPLVEEEEGFEFSKVYDKFLSDFVVIKDHSEPVKPLMTADQRANLNSNIQLAIQQAQIALAQGNESLFRLNIENAVLWMGEFFKQDDKSKELISQLNQLKIQPIEVNYPNALNAKKALDEISQQQLYRWLEGSLQQSTINPIQEQPKLQPTESPQEQEIDQ